MTQIVAYVPNPTSYSCRVWEGGNMLLPLIQSGIDLFVTGFTFVEQVKHYLGFVPRDELQQNRFVSIIRNSMFLVGVNIAPSISSYAYSYKCHEFDPKIQKRMAEVSQKLVDVIKHAGTSYSNLISNYNDIFQNPHSKISYIATDASKFLKKYFPQEKRLQLDPSPMGLDMINEYFQILKKNSSDGKIHLNEKEKKEFNAWVNFLEVIQS